MALSIAFGGVFERSEVMNVFPADLGSPWLAMALLVAMMVVVGMLMDPYGAVILVSATISSVAYTNGIHPAHFWLMVLTAFELGYLSPPVALNQLLTRQVIGGEAYDPPGEGGLWRRHEKILLPVTVMGIALLVVAFVPLFFYDPLPKP
jgi:TRAP-type C4-dicarboxylate transport system permease large subunit